MSFTKSTTDIKVHEKLGDEPNIDDGLSAEQLKERFDYPAETLQTDLNNLIDELALTNASNNIGAEPLFVGDSSNGTVQKKLEYLHSEIEGVEAGAVPDNSISKTKLVSSFASTIAEKDGTLQTNLNSEKVGGETLANLKADMLSYPFAIGGFTNATQTINLGFTPRAVLISSGATRNGNSITNGMYLITTSNPTYYFSNSGTAVSGNIFEIVENGFQFNKLGNYTPSDAVGYGTGYRYIAIR